MTEEGCIQPDIHVVLFQVALADSKELGLPLRAEIPAVVPAARYALCCGHSEQSLCHPKPAISFLWQNHVRKDQGNTAGLSLQHQHGTGTINKSPYFTESLPPAQPVAQPSVQVQGCTKHFGGQKLFLLGDKGYFFVAKRGMCSCSKTFAPNRWSFSSQPHPKTILLMLTLNNPDQFPLAVQFITHPARGFLPGQVSPLPTV